jgi:hypothetical protein
MPINDPLTVVVRVPQGSELGAAMKELRVWLDRENIQTIHFETNVDDKGSTFKIRFRSIGDADRLRAELKAQNAQQQSELARDLTSAQLNTVQLET